MASSRYRLAIHTYDSSLVFELAIKANWNSSFGTNHHHGSKQWPIRRAPSSIRAGDLVTLRTVRLVSRYLNATVEPMAFSSVMIQFEDPDDGCFALMGRKLLSMIAGGHSARWTRTLRMYNLGPDLTVNDAHPWLDEEQLRQLHH